MYSILMYDENNCNWTDIYISDNYKMMKNLYNKVIKKYNTFSFKLVKVMFSKVGD